MATLKGKEALLWLKKSSKNIVYDKTERAFQFKEGKVHGFDASGNFGQFEEDVFLEEFGPFHYGHQIHLVKLLDGSLKYDFDKFDCLDDAILDEWRHDSPSKDRSALEAILDLAYDRSVYDAKSWKRLVDMYIDIDSKSSERDHLCYCEKVQKKIDAGQMPAREEFEDCAIEAFNNPRVSEAHDWFLTVYGEYEGGTKDIRYCPFCGRKLS
jgi:hypothetical protein